MFILCAFVCAVLAFLMLGTGAAQLNRVPQAVAVLERVGARKLVTLSGWLLLGAAAGLVIGLFWAPLGIVAGAGLIVYFLVAALAHVRIRDSFGQVLNPLVPGVIAAIALVLRVITA